ncbi:hemerythrin domain-containing protein [Flavitalea sp. BT771]|uniref:hemerythrin domain-containing protein n=1 Tax=Flavitalea sp. BT771 TaxID=3063329 RepID=UPI0026E16D57|nr:hemerythrin domain-containing protein [Flavitalea sp. BT771]MDO6429382.1 hemerythrin domain-containing protein [Flavitalea sp. BT771]MDV6218490.1 hemerythrin domain-containing protein [Flavitalea sp. BT771]
MKKQAPIKRHKAIVSFSQDHHAGLLLVWKIRQGLSKSVSAERITGYVLFSYKEDLEKHFRDEERLLFSKLPVADVLRRQAEADHRAIYTLVAALERNKMDESLLRELADRMEEHIRFEERALFNHLQDILSPEDLGVIASRLPNDSKGLGETWKDQFWL